ncbi:MAG: radical SAM protein [Nitrospinae bacterium]|nr:radical SAM protein [Nitrospinota bacterium]
MRFDPEAIYIEPGAENYPLTGEVLRRFPNVPALAVADAETVVAELKRTRADVFGAGKKQLVLSRFKGPFLKKCPGTSKGMVCCNYYVVNLIKNCAYDCSYCFLQDFLENNPVLTAFVNVEDLLRELDAVFRENPGRVFRVGTGELTDSLALEDAVPYADYLVPFFKERKNAALELKTKSARIESLLRHGGADNIVVSWSLNPQEAIDREEKGTASLEARLEAARKCRENGFRIGVHFDPILLFPGWERAYEEVVDALFLKIPPSAIEWISLGSFRYRPNLKQVARERHGENMLFVGEHVQCEDGKFRYLRPVRNRAYETLRHMLKRRSRDLSVYLCMETKEVWEKTTGKLPRSDEKLDQFFDL